MILSFCEEGIQNPDYAGLAKGRIEVWGEGAYPESELSVLCKRADWDYLREKWQDEPFSKELLKEVEMISVSQQVGPTKEEAQRLKKESKEKERAEKKRIKKQVKDFFSLPPNNRYLKAIQSIRVKEIMPLDEFKNRLDYELKATAVELTNLYKEIINEKKRTSVAEGQKEAD